MSDSDPGPRRRRRVLKWGVVGVVVAAAVVFVLVGANWPPDPRLEPAADRGAVIGFGEIAFQVDPAGSGKRCALLAETSEQHERGLMGRKDLGGYDGMLFRFSTDTTVAFYMKDTPLPLSIAWFDAEGRFVSAADMQPCLDEVDCPLYRAARPYRYALEVERGGLPGLGIGPGSAITVGGGCT